MSGNAAPGRKKSLVDLRLQEIGLQIDRVLAEMPDSRLEAQRLIADVFGKMPSAEMLHAFTQLAESAAKPEIQTDLERKIILMRLLVDLELHCLTRPGLLDRLTLDGASWKLPELILRVEAFRRTSDWDPPELGPTELNQLGKLRKALMPDITELQAFALVVPRVAHLAAAARDARMGEIQFLTGQDADLFRRAFADASETYPNRILIYAVALRWTIQEDLHAWAQIPPAERNLDKSDGKARRQRDGLSTAENSRPVVLEDLELDLNAYHVLSKRMQSDQDTARSEGQDDLVQDLSAAQQALFAVYLELTAAVRNPAGAAVDEDDPAAVEARRRLLQQVQEAEESSAARERGKEEVLLEALTAVRDGRTHNPEAQLPPGARSMRRERLRRRILLGVTAALTVTAVAVNVLLMTRGGRAVPVEIKAGEFSAAMSLNAVTPLGSTMFSETSASAWESMPEEERMQRLQDLGSLAQEKGFKRVVLLDDDRNELARWSVRDGVHVPPR
ncbi:MAG: hypothetical protein E2P04_06960 [Acidobacteria bacterium]|nr:MAG: hypothetical protein E2P04_06960 [Acidobacteriota bacterium]